MKHLFVHYELAVIAKEKGFNEPCCTYFLNKELQRLDGYGIDNSLFDEDNGRIAAPLYQQLIDWFRENHGIYISPYPVFRGEEIGFYKVDFAVKGETYDTEELFGVLNDTFKSHYEALNKSLEEAFKLI